MEREPSMGIEPAQSGRTGPIDDIDDSIIGRIAGTAPGPGETICRSPS
jgi:hypothetical protein